jgi:hypothetical protein
MTKLKFDEIEVGSTMYDKWHEVKVVAKATHTDSSGHVVPDIHVVYVNQVNGSEAIRGDGNLDTDPLHCWSCKKDLIDNVRLNICPDCHRAICPDSRCAECHCGTTWDPKLGRRVKLV